MEIEKWFSYVGLSCLLQTHREVGRSSRPNCLSVLSPDHHHFFARPRICRDRATGGGSRGELDEKILEAEIVPAGPGKTTPQPSAAMALLDPAFSEEAAAVETVEVYPKNIRTRSLSVPSTGQRFDATKASMHRRHVRKMVISWLVLMFNLSALVGFTYFAVDMWDINRDCILRLYQ